MKIAIFQLAVMRCSKTNNKILGIYPRFLRNNSFHIRSSLRKNDTSHSSFFYRNFTSKKRYYIFQSWNLTKCKIRFWTGADWISCRNLISSNIDEQTLSTGYATWLFFRQSFFLRFLSFLRYLIMSTSLKNSKLYFHAKTELIWWKLTRTFVYYCLIKLI